MSEINDFSDLLRDGLSSSNTYVFLTKKGRNPISLQFKPYIERIDEKTVFFGGKLSVFWVGDSDGAEVKLGNAFKGIPSYKSSNKRVGTEIGFAVRATHGQKIAALETAVVKPSILNMLKGVEKALGVEIEDRRRVVNAIKAFYMSQAEYDHIFSGKHVRGLLKQTEIGEKSKVFNKAVEDDKEALAEFKDSTAKAA